MLRETWEAREDTEESVVTHLLLMQLQLAKMTELVQENLQKVQKTWYDRNARLREFKLGDSQLVLLPTSTCPVARVPMK